MSKLYVSVSKQVIYKNAREGTEYPPIAVRKGKSGKARYVRHLKIKGPCEIIYSPHKPILKCGARLVIIAEE